MRYKELIQKVQDYSGFSTRESEDSLRLIIESMSARLSAGERQVFAIQLPQELQDLAMEPESTSFTTADFYEELSEIEGINRKRVKQQAKAVWCALKDAIAPGEISHLKAQLPSDLSADLH